MPAAKLDQRRIAVLQGGPSAEAEVSRVSAEGIASALAAAFTHVERIELDASVVERLLELAPDAVFPALHGPPGEDGTVQGMLEMLGLPYAGSGVHASACAMDKLTTKQLLRAAHLPLADDVVIRRDEPRAAAAERVLDTLGERLAVKPTRQGSAVGVALIEQAAALPAALDAAFTYDALALVERRIEGREITVGVLDHVDARGATAHQALPVVEIETPLGTWYDYHHRYTPGESRHVLPAPLDPALQTRFEALAVAAHTWLGCRDLSRADFLLSQDGEPVLLEVNTLPGMTPTSLYPDAAAAAGIDFTGLLAQMVRNALRRGPDRPLAPPADRS